MVKTFCRSIVGTNIITFEMPMQPLVRSALKIESLLQDLQVACMESHPLLHQHALLSCSEIIHLTNKPEFKSHFLKEFIKITHLNDKTNATHNNKHITAIKSHIQHLGHRAEPFAYHLLKDPFIYALHNANVFNPKEMDYRSPRIILWMHADYKERQASFKKWIEALTPLLELIRTYLSFLRQGSVYEDISFHQGCYQCSLPKHISCQLVSVHLAEEWQLIPKIQQGHNWLTIGLHDAFSITSKIEKPDKIALGICQY